LEVGKEQDEDLDWWKDPGSGGPSWRIRDFCGVECWGMSRVMAGNVSKW